MSCHGLPNRRLPNGVSALLGLNHQHRNDFKKQSPSIEQTVKAFGYAKMRALRSATVSPRRSAACGQLLGKLC
jgi:hypothetical protein